MQIDCNFDQDNWSFTNEDYNNSYENLQQEDYTEGFVQPNYEFNQQLNQSNFNFQQENNQEQNKNEFFAFINPNDGNQQEAQEDDDKFFQPPNTHADEIEQVIQSPLKGKILVGNEVMGLLLPSIPTRLSQLKNDEGYIGGEVIGIPGGVASLDQEGKVPLEQLPPIPTAGVKDVKVNGSSVVDNEVASVSVPTKVSQLQNDSQYATESEIPVNLSDLNNDTGFITDADIPTDLSAFQNDVGYITQDDIPTNISAFTNDSGYITQADVPTDLSDFNNDVGFITSSDIPTNISSFNNDVGYITSSGVPTKVSQLQNDSGYITQSAIPTNVSAFTNDAGYITNATAQIAEAQVTNLTTDLASKVDLTTNQEISGQKDFNTTPRVKVAHTTHNLPDAYQEVEYLESTGTQYINTGFIPTNDNYAFEIDLSFLSTPNTANGYIGYRNVASATVAGNMRYYFIYSDGRMAVRNGVAAENSTWTATLGMRYTISYISKALYQNDSKIVQSSQQSASPTYKSFYLFGVNTDGYYSADLGTMVGKIYECKLYAGDTLVHNFIPCYRVSDDEPGMYDIVTNTFHTNQGTGDFNVGSDVFPYTYESLLTDANFAPVAFSGSYSDLVNKPTNVSAFTNDAGYVTSSYHDSTKANQSSLNDVTAKIPSEASSSNQLADKNFVNSSIATATATFLGTYPSVADIEALTADENDYAFYQHTDAAGNTLFDRYKYSNSQWLYEYTLNNSSFTADQWAAINSGVSTGEWVDKSTAQVINGQKDFNTSPRIRVEAHKGAHNLPDDYQELQYVSSLSAAGVIDTALSVNTSTHYATLRVSLINYTGNYGTIMGNNSAPQLAYNRTQWYVGNTGGNGSATAPKFDGTIFTLRYSYNSIGDYYVDGADTNLRRTGSLRIMFFSNSSTGSGDNAAANIYSAEIYQKSDDSLIYQFVPAKSNLSNQVGLYETVNDVFYAGVGVTAGPEDTSGETIIKYLPVLTGGNFAQVAYSGSYNDLLNKPTIPTVGNGTITIQKNSTTVGTFTTNQSNAKTIDISVPTKVSDLTNDSGFITDAYHDSTKEDISNKVISISSSSTNTQYPSAKCVYDNVQNVREVAEGKTNTYVVDYLNNAIFNSQEDKIEISSFTTIGDIVVDESDLKIGDNVYVVELDVPDRWCCGKKSSSVIQLCNKTEPTGTNKWFSSTGASEGLWTRTVDSVNNLITFTKKETTTSANFQLGNFNAGVTIESTHKYLTRWYVENNLGTSGWLSESGGSPSNTFSAGTQDYVYLIATGEVLDGSYFYFFCANTQIDQGSTLTIGKPQVFDLTLMYGAGSEPTTYAEFIEDYPNNFYPYNTDPGSEVAVLSKLETAKVPITSISVNGTNISPINENVNITVPTDISAFTNDSEYITNSTAQITEAQVTNLSDDLLDIREVAEGKKQTFVVSDVTNLNFNSQNDDITISSFTDITGNIFDATNTSIGDTIYVKELDVPDRWVSLKLANIIQRAENGNFVDNTYWPFGSISNNILIWSPRFQYDANSYSKKVTFIQNHKYLIMITYKSTGGSNIQTSISSATYGTFGTAVACRSSDNWVTSYAISTVSTTKSETMQFMNLQYSEGYTIYFKDFMIVDLTETFGAGNEPTTLEEFKTYYPNDYYSYNETQGTQSLILSKLETAKVPITSISVNSTNITPVNSNVDITVPTTNDINTLIDTYMSTHYDNGDTEVY